jgi:hypothetical protein
VACGRLDAMVLQHALTRRITVVGAVSDHSIWLCTREALLGNGLDGFGFMRRSVGDDAVDRMTMAVCYRHEFTAFSAASRADSSPRFFAELRLASMKVFGRSSLPRARRCSASAYRSSVTVLSSCHS